MLVCAHMCVVLVQELKKAVLEAKAAKAAKAAKSATKDSQR